MAEKFDWNPEKSASLLARHGVSFEDVVIAFQDGRLLADTDHPGEVFAHQRIAVVRINDYAYAVPYVMDGNVRFLKTLYPSRKLQKSYLSNPDDNDR